MTCREPQHFHDTLKEADECAGIEWVWDADLEMSFPVELNNWNTIERTSK